MIGVFDSGHGGLTILRVLAGRFPRMAFVYLGDHANMPYGDKPSADIVSLTCSGVEALFRLGCRLVLLGCNTATCVAARALQRDWLPASEWRGCNVLGIVAPTVEAATQTPWAVTTPQYPQKYNTDVVAVFGTTRTISSRAYPEEIRKRCPRVTVVQQACAELASAIEMALPEAQLDELVERSVIALLVQAREALPHRAILGCTHYPLVGHLFRRHLPPSTRILSQPEVVADSLENYLDRHPSYANHSSKATSPILLTSGDPVRASLTARVFWPEAPMFEQLEARD
jgi:glutamate racemase